MMRKRTSSSPDPKNKKRINEPQQTESVKKPAENEEKVLLDYLVVKKIASLTKVKFAPDICQELVSVAFANALRSFYSSEKLSLSIACRDFQVFESDNPDILLSISSFSQRCKEEINMEMKNLDRVVHQIFARFPQINLKLEGENIEDIAVIVHDALNIAPDVTIECLKVRSIYSHIIRCHKLLKKLSTNLRVLNLRINLSLRGEEDGALSEKFWRIVSSCAQLVRLSAVFDVRRELVEEDYLFKHISDCLQLLKIKHFRTNLEERVGPGYSEMDWLPTALVENENLRHLALDPSAVFPYWGYYGEMDDKVLLVLGRLDSLKINIMELFEYRSDWVSFWETVLPVLRENAVLKVSPDICFERDINKSIFDMLMMYLQLSHQKARTIKLRLLIGKDNDVDAVTMFNRALNRLSSTKKFRGLTKMRVGSWTQIIFGNANLMVKTCVSSTVRQIF